MYGVLFIAISQPAYGQTERWVFRYNGPADSTDVANSLVYGADGIIYATGRNHGSGTGAADFIVISLNKDTGDTNWIYQYNGPGNDADVANSIVYGADGNVYAAGYSDSSSRDLIVISLTSNGSERWVYRYNGPGNSGDGGSSIVWGLDGNLYAAGGTTDINADFTIISLTQSGAERWIYTYNGLNNGNDGAYSIVYGDDGNIYSAGYSRSYGIETNFTVLSVTSAGTERWVYADSVSEDGGAAYRLVYGADGNIYAAGVFGYNYFTVVSLTSGGGERWVYSIPPPHSACEGHANSIAYGLDGNIYAAGVSDTTSEYPLTSPGFTVASIASTGSERWVYRYCSGLFDWANSIIYGADSNLYAAGMCFQGTRAFAVISLTPAGGERWIYRYNTPYVDEAYSVVYGTDGNVYAAGFSENRNTPFAQDFLVVSLDPQSGIEECSPARSNKESILSAASLQRRRLEFSLSLPEPMNVQMTLYDIVGEKILSWAISVSEGTACFAKDLSALSTGIYFLCAETSGKEYRGTVKFIYTK